MDIILADIIQLRDILRKEASRWNHNIKSKTWLKIIDIDCNIGNIYTCISKYNEWVTAARIYNKIDRNQLKECFRGPAAKEDQTTAMQLFRNIGQVIYEQGTVHYGL